MSTMPTTIAVLALILAYVSLVAAYLALRTLARLRRTAAVLARGSDGPATIIESAQRQVSRTTELAAELEQLRAELASVRTQSEASERAGRSALDRRLTEFDSDNARALRNVALVRYDAFDDMAGRMSFSLALLDDAGDGLTLTAIAGRSDTRVYAKGVQAGAGEHELSPEETQAVGAALRRPARSPLMRRRAS